MDFLSPFRSVIITNLSNIWDSNQISPIFGINRQLLLINMTLFKRQIQMSFIKSALRAKKRKKVNYCPFRLHHFATFNSIFEYNNDLGYTPGRSGFGQNYNPSYCHRNTARCLSCDSVVEAMLRFCYTCLLQLYGANYTYCNYHSCTVDFVSIYLTGK